MICTNCGREIPDGSSRCYCGQTFDISGQPAAQTAEGDTVGTQGTMSEPGSVISGSAAGSMPGAETVVDSNPLVSPMQAANPAGYSGPAVMPVQPIKPMSGAGVVQNPGPISGTASGNMQPVTAMGTGPVTQSTAPAGMTAPTQGAAPAGMAAPTQGAALTGMAVPTQGAALAGMAAPTQGAAPSGINSQPVMSGSILGASQRIDSMNRNAANTGFQQPQQSYIPKEPVKNQNNTGLIVTLCIVVALLVGIIAFLVFYLNRPIYKIEQAMEKENIEKVVALYPKLTKDEDQDYVQDQMFDYANSLKNQFVNGEVEYEEINQTLTDLGDVILGEYPGYDDLKQSVEDLKESRAAFVEAENAFQLEDYETALAQYEMVIPEDSNYEAAQDGIEKVKEFLVPDIVGTWSAEIDLGSYLTGQMGYGSSDLSFTLELVYEFGEDGTAACYIDEDSIYANKQSFTDYLMEMLYEYYEMSLGMDRDEIDSYLSVYYGMTMAEMLEEELDVDELLREMTYGMQTEEFEYRLEADAFVIEKDNEEVRMYIEMPDQDTLLLTGTDNPNMNDSTLELLSQIGMDFPMTFKRK